MLTLKNVLAVLLVTVVAAAIIVTSGCGPKSMDGRQVVDARMDPEYRGISEFNKMNKMETPVETAAGPSDKPIVDPSYIQSMNDEYKLKRDQLIAKEVKRGLVNPGYPLADLNETGRGLRVGSNTISFEQKVIRIEGIIDATGAMPTGVITTAAPTTIKMSSAGKTYVLPVNKPFSQRLPGSTSIVLHAPIGEYMFIAREVRGYDR